MTTKISQLPANQQIAWAAATPAVTVSTPLLDAQQTWNAGAVTFTGLKLNVTDTASASASLLMDLQVATVSKFSVTKGGVVAGFSFNAGNRFTAPSGGSFDFGDVFLARDAANTLALRNGVSANSFKVANTWTDVSNQEYGVFDWISSANVLTIGTTNAGTGVARNLRFVVGGVNKADYSVSNSNSWTFQGGIAVGGFVSASTYLASSTTNTQSGTTYSMTSTDSDIIFTNAATCTLTLQPAASFQGRMLRVKTTGGGSVVSASSNVVPKAGGAAGTAILAAAAGTWAELKSDGTNWIVMAGT